MPELDPNGRMGPRMKPIIGCGGEDLIDHSICRAMGQQEEKLKNLRQKKTKTIKNN